MEIMEMDKMEMGLLLLLSLWFNVTVDGIMEIEMMDI